MKYTCDANKIPSSGISHRAPFSLQLLQHNHAILLDDLFMGLEWDLTIEVEKIWNKQGTRGEWNLCLC